MKYFIRRPLEFFTHHLNSWQKQMHDRSVMETAHNRTLVVSGVFCLAFIVIGCRLFDVMIWQSHTHQQLQGADHTAEMTVKRADILDRNGNILATHLVTGSVYANPKVIINPEDAALKLSNLFPDLGYENLLKKLKSTRGFVWIVRHISPKMQKNVNDLGIPGVYLQRDERRVYPHGRLVSHVLGYCGIDNDGLSGIEQYFDARLRKDPNPLSLSIDVRVQHIVREELEKAIAEFRAVGGNCMIQDINTGEILAMVSLPDFDPNLPSQNAVETTFNRNTLGTYECGSVFKIFNTAIALESGTAKLTSIYDASRPIRIGGRDLKTTDFKGKNRPLTVQEVFVYSSNLGSAKMALEFGGEVQRQYLGRFGLLKAPKLEIFEIAHPTVPKHWSDYTTATVSYGYGVAISPLMLLDGVRTVVMGRKRFATTLLKRTGDMALKEDHSLRVVSEKTSSHLRDLMRAQVMEGNGFANVSGYDVFGKTGSAHKNKGRRYTDDKNCIWVGGFPKDKPRYLVKAGLDSPKPTKNSHGYSTAGWNAAPLAGRIISRFAPLMGVHRVVNSAIMEEQRLFSVRDDFEDD